MPFTHALKGVAIEYTGSLKELMFSPLNLMTLPFRVMNVFQTPMVKARIIAGEVLEQIPVQEI